MKKERKKFQRENVGEDAEHDADDDAADRQGDEDFPTHLQYGHGRFLEVPEIEMSDGVIDIVEYLGHLGERRSRPEEGAEPVAEAVNRDDCHRIGDPYRGDGRRAVYIADRGEKDGQDYLDAACRGKGDKHANSQTAGNCPRRTA